MSRARLRVCLAPGCPNMQDSSRCDEHQLARRLASSTERGYGHGHRKLRAGWKPKVEAGLVDCARCQQRIAPDAAWELGHDDEDRTIYRGPEHRTCNRLPKGRMPHPATKLTIVTGPPCAGKTTYVRKHAEQGDVVIDFDAIAVALGSTHDHDHSAPIAAVAQAARRAAMQAAVDTDANVWIIDAAPSRQTLGWYRSKHARIITIDPGETTVRHRITAERGPQAQQWADVWYANH